MGTISILVLALSVLLPPALIVIMVLCFKLKIKFTTALYSSTAAIVAVFFGAAANAEGNVIQQSIDGVIEEARYMLSQMPTIDLDAMDASLDMLRDTYMLLFPSIIILTILLLVYIAYMLVKKFYQLATKTQATHIPPFCETRINKPCTIMLGVSVAGAFFATGGTAAALLNISVLLAGVSAFCGLSLADFYLSRSVKFFALRLIIYVLLYFVLAPILNIIFYVLVILAVVDAYVNLRKKARVF